MPGEFEGSDWPGGAPFINAPITSMVVSSIFFWTWGGKSSKAKFVALT